jgi:endonuclease/exonuclease/phosphatase family metal-dependent hydrolase
MPQDLEPLLLETLGAEWQMEYETPPKNSYDNGICILWNKSALEGITFERLSLPLIPQAKLWEKAWIRVHGFGRNAFLLQKGALVGTFKWNNRRLRITSLHLDWQGGLKQRTAQLAFIRDYLISRPNADHEIICGDFNTIGVLNKKRQIKLFLEVLGNRFQDAAANPEDTFPPFLLDHIFVKNLQSVQFQTSKLPGSDHFPVLAKLVV